MSADAKDIVLHLAELRMRQKLTQADVARRLHVDRSAVAKFEAAGNVKLQTVLDYLSAIGAVLNIRLDPPEGAQ